MAAVFDPKGKTFVVTGGASGMGALHVGNYLDQGAKAVAILDVAEEQGKALAERYNKKYPGKAVFFKCDVSKEEEIENTFNAVVAKLEKIDVIINNAGIMVDTPKVWRTASELNWLGLVSFTLKGIKHMSNAEGGAGGVIMNIASTVALSQQNPFLPIYSGSKSAVLHFSQCISRDPFTSTTGIRLLCMCVGPTDTALLRNLESRTLVPEAGKMWEREMQKVGISNILQRPESAVAAVDHAIKHGAGGSTWLTIKNKPAKNITPVLDQAFKLYDNAMNE